MTDSMQKESQKAGLPPGSLVHVGEIRTDTVLIKSIDYEEKNLSESAIHDIAVCANYRDSSSVSWINVDGLQDTQTIEQIGNIFNLHPLTLEDILNTHHRPKLEIFDDYLFIVVKMLTFNETSRMVESEQVSIVLGKHFVISFQERQGDVFDDLRERIRTGKGRIRKMGPDYLTYGLIDSIVDNYFIIIEKMGEEIESMDEQLLNHPTEKTLRQIYLLKRQLISLRKAVWPLRELVSGLQHAESPLVKKGTYTYLRDAYDHTIHVADSIESFRDVASGLLDIYLSSISNRMNDVMKTLTIIATLFIPLTFIAGIYGMNFKFMPELEWRWSYPAVLVSMVAAGIGLIVFFKKKKWF